MEACGIKRAIAVVLLILLVLSIGCGARHNSTKTVPALSKGASAKSTASTSSADSSTTTSSAVSTVDSDLESIDDIDEFLNTTELDTLDEDLDFEI